MHNIGVGEEEEEEEEARWRRRKINYFRQFEVRWSIKATFSEIKKKKIHK